MRSVESRLSIHGSFGDHNMQVSTLGRGGGGGSGYSNSLRLGIVSHFNFMKSEKERDIFNL